MTETVWLVVRTDSAGVEPGRPTPGVLQTRMLAALAEHGGQVRPAQDGRIWTAAFSGPDAALTAAWSIMQTALTQGAAAGWPLRIALLPAGGEHEAVLAGALPGEIVVDAAFDVATAVPNNLPRMATRFVGRRRDIADIAESLVEHRAVVLVGPPGAGKSRLAHAVAGEVLRSCPAGVWVADLAPLVEPEMLLQAVAAAVGVKEEPGRDLLAALTERFGAANALLLLDNCEHLAIVAAGLAEQLLARCPGLGILATSQTPLSLPGAVHSPVGGLSLPEGTHGDDPAAVLRSEAARLFVDRALAVDPSFAVSATNAAALAEICRSLDGLPLAVEMAAARVHLLSLPDMVRRLDDRFRLLGRSVASPRSRHETLRTALDWHHELLRPAEQVLWRRLSVFAGPFSLAAAEAVCPDETPGTGGLLAGDVVELLAELVQRAVVTVHPIGEEKYFRLLESFRQYGREQLEAAGETAVLHRRLREYYAGLVERLADTRGLFGPEQGHLSATLDATYENLRLALRWSLDAGEAEAGVRMATGLIRYWHGRGQLTEGKYWLDRMLAAYPDRTPLRAWALYGSGALAFQQGEMDAAEALLRLSLATAKEAEDKRGMGRALNLLANLAGVRRDDAACQAAYAESLALYRALGDQKAVASLLNNAALLPKLQGDYPAARALFEESLAMLRAGGDQAGAALALSHIGELAKWTGDLAAATAAYEESLVLARSSGNAHALARVLVLQGELGLAQGKVEAAEACLEGARDLCRQQGAQHSLVRIHANLGHVARLRSEWDRAAHLLQESLVGAVKQRDMLLIAETLEGLAWLADAVGRRKRAVRLLGAAQALRTRLNRPLPPDRQSQQKHRLAQLRGILGPALYRREWAEGQQLELLQAVSYAQSPEGAEAEPRRGRPRQDDRPGGLTPREEEVVRLIAGGATSQEIARQLVLSQRTVEKYEERIRIKLAVPNRASLAAWAATHLPAERG